MVGDHQLAFYNLYPYLEDVYLPFLKFTYIFSPDVSAVNVFLVTHETIESSS